MDEEGDAVSTETDPWGAHASTYDRLFAPLTGYVAHGLLALADGHIRQSARVLDVGCGSGALLVPAIERAVRRRRRGDQDHVVGCDVSPGMVALAETKARAFDIEAFCCDVQNGEALGYEDGAFDAVFSCFGIFLFEDRGAGWREAARVLAAGGVFATTTWLPPERNEMFRAQFGPVMAALPARLTENMSPPGWMVVAEPDGLRSEVAAAGFMDVEVRPFHASMVLPNVDVAWAAMLENPGSSRLLEQCTHDELRAVQAAYTQSMTERAGGPDRPVLLEASCNLLVARRG